MSTGGIKSDIPVLALLQLAKIKIVIYLLAAHMVFKILYSFYFFFSCTYDELLGVIYMTCHYRSHNLMREP